ncbi:uncharacterized protein LOC124847654 [Vigna umbellata]|uniref:uncharacterized protein LOC124847654 n=1 Tax=Vigna umbellata TaxID=87088 RepID=UPI001F5EFEC2|nr:uncharacterized protein LOC124847654 [Vigna umbellata]
MKPTIECLHVFNTVGQADWRKEVIQLIKEKEEGKFLQVKDAKRISRYLIVDGDLYRRGYTMPMMKCLSVEEAEYVMRELHEGICGRHTGGLALRARMLRARFFWTTIEKDFFDFTQKCISFQKHGNVFNAPATELHGIVSPWSLAQWGMDIVGPFPVGLGITHIMSLVEHPQTNGQAEVANKIIVQELKKRLREAKGSWVDELQ